MAITYDYIKDYVQKLYKINYKSLMLEEIHILNSLRAKEKEYPLLVAVFYQPTHPTPHRRDGTGFIAKVDGKSYPRTYTGRLNF